MSEQKLLLEILAEVRGIRADLSGQMERLALAVGGDVGRLAQRVEMVEGKLNRHLEPGKRRPVAVK